MTIPKYVYIKVAMESSHSDLDDSCFSSEGRSRAASASTTPECLEFGCCNRWTSVESQRECPLHPTRSKAMDATPQAPRRRLDTSTPEGLEASSLDAGPLNRSSINVSNPPRRPSRLDSFTICEEDWEVRRECSRSCWVIPIPPEPKKPRFPSVA
jgi:hypothetical protein